MVTDQTPLREMSADRGESSNNENGNNDNSNDSDVKIGKLYHTFLCSTKT